MAPGRVLTSAGSDRHALLDLAFNYVMLLRYNRELAMRNGLGGDSHQLSAIASVVSRAF
jgi:hypothetical protein